MKWTFPDPARTLHRLHPRCRNGRCRRGGDRERPEHLSHTFLHRRLRQARHVRQQPASRKSGRALLRRRRDGSDSCRVQRTRSARRRAGRPVACAWPRTADRTEPASNHGVLVTGGKRAAPAGGGARRGERTALEITPVSDINHTDDSGPVTAQRWALADTEWLELQDASAAGVVAANGIIRAPGLQRGLVVFAPNTRAR